MTPSRTHDISSLVQDQALLGRLLVEAEQRTHAQDLHGAVATYDRLFEVHGRLSDGIATANQSRPPGAEPMSPPDVILNALLVQADLLDTLGERTRAHEGRQRALMIAGAGGSPERLAEVQRSVAMSMLTEGRFNDALTLMAQARDVFFGAEQLLSGALAASDMANIFEWLGDKERAYAEVDRASTLIAPALARGARSNRMGVLSALIKGLGSGDLGSAVDATRLLQVSLALDQVRARLAIERGDYDEADHLLARVEREIPAVARPAVEFQRVRVLLGQRRYAEALKKARALEPAFTGLLRPKWGVLQRLLAEALLGLGQPSEALSHVNAAIQDQTASDRGDTLWRLHALHARALLTLDRPQEALAAFVRSASFVEDLRKAPLGYRIDSLFLVDKLSMFVEAIQLAHELGASDDCLRLVEIVKARLLVTTLRVPQSAVARSGPAVRVDELSRAIDALDYSGAMGTSSTDHAARRAALLAEREALLEQLRLSDPRFRALTEPTRFDYQGVQAQLRARGQTAIELFFHEDRVLALLLDGERCVSATLTLNPETRARLDRYLNALDDSQPLSDQERLPRFDPSEDAGLQADELIPGELLERASHSTALILSPHGALHLLPWAGLAFRGRRLFEQVPVGVLPCLGCLLPLSGTAAGRPRVAIIGAPEYLREGLAALPSASVEIEAIRSVYAQAGGLLVEPLTGGKATEAAFFALLERPDAKGAILHVSCHGRFDELDPMAAALLLADGAADAAEISLRRTTFDEVILSACSTGRRPAAVHGVQLLGDDVLGLPGALLEAGARAVLVSIPPAKDDATQALLSRYHRQRAEGRSPLVSLQRAQQAMLRGGIYPLSQWIGFTVYGVE